MHACVSLAGIGLVTVVCYSSRHLTNVATVALSYLLLVLFVATISNLWIAVSTSVAAALTFNFFFLPPVGTLFIADPQNLVTFVAFMTVSLVASHLSSVAQTREHELARLFRFSRDVLLATGEPDALRSLARHIAERFQLDDVAICVPAGAGFDRHESAASDLASLLTTADLQRVLTERRPSGPGLRKSWSVKHPVVPSLDERRPVWLLPLQDGARAIGVLAVAGRQVEPGTLNALASVVAIAIERVHLLEERKQAEISKRSAELKSALLASLAHDLRTPLTAVGTAVSNLGAPSLTEPQRAGQVDLALSALGRLTRLLLNILEMTRIDAGGIEPSLRWVHPSEVIQAARSQSESTLRGHRLAVVDRSSNWEVHLDPRLLATALAHLLENAAQYSSDGSMITITHEVMTDGLRLAVEDEGGGIAAADLPHLFERFFRGSQSFRYDAGTGMGLAIVQGLLAVQGGRVWAENRAEGGARFSMFAPADCRVAARD
jgi:two-component system sensor histidine kinase KdpD